ncbi:RNA polymerase sigma factor [Lolliginicoccus suaedae]|uniref:RNA polymerase sigma factor n=1 Tax=Lolliginicoccus suaedae TaxID=2605429 RepID=UPI0011EC7A77|nr:sigma-70 family RNA polymerase sigma factor [Lolliginicoccus suaedae]
MTSPLSPAEAFRTHIAPEVEVMLRVARTLTGNHSDAEDLVQETLIRAWRAIDSFDGQYPRAWLLTILRRTHINMNRRQRPDVIEDPAGQHRARPAFNATADVTPEDQVLDATLSSEIERSLAGLDPRFRTALLLVDVDSLSYAEAAEVLGVPIGTVMSRLSRARDRMRRSLREQGVLGPHTAVR